MGMLNWGLTLLHCHTATLLEMYGSEIKAHERPQVIEVEARKMTLVQEVMSGKKAIYSRSHWVEACC